MSRLQAWNTASLLSSLRSGGGRASHNSTRRWRGGSAAWRRRAVAHGQQLEPAREPDPDLLEPTRYALALPRARWRAGRRRACGTPLPPPRHSPGFRLNPRRTAAGTGHEQLDGLASWRSSRLAPRSRLARAAPSGGTRQITSPRTRSASLLVAITRSSGQQAEQPLHQLGRRLHQVLAGIEHKQHLPRPERLGQSVSQRLVGLGVNAKGGHDQRHEPLRRVRVSEVDDPGPVRVVRAPGSRPA